MVTRFCLLGCARTGSSYLASALNTVPDIACQNEVFHPQTIYVLRGTDLRLLGSTADRDRDPIAFLDKVHEATLCAFPQKKIVGVKLLEFQCRAVWAHLLRSPDYAKVFIYRENKLAQLSSEKIARQTNEWSIFTLPKKPQSKVVFAADEFRRELEFQKSVEEKIFTQARSGDSSVFTIEYRSIKDSAKLRALASFLGSAWEGEMKGMICKQNTPDILSRFTNPDEVVKLLREIGKEHWVYEESP